jgi:hypothetical protein
MPHIDLIPDVLYDAMMPYYVDFDNLPLKNIIYRQELINAVVDSNTILVQSAKGSAYSLAARLAKSLEDDGSLKTDSIDDALHNIGLHTDGEGLDGEGNIVDFVRMKESERDKLSLVSDKATSLQIMIQTPSVEVVFDDDIMQMVASDTVTWTVEGSMGSQKVKAHMNFPTSIAHRHIYDLIPVHYNLITPDYQTYKVNSISSPYIEDSLRVYINGIKISTNEEIYVPGPTGPSSTWYLTSFTPDYENGTFVLNRPVDADDVICIDFDLSLNE